MVGSPFILMQRPGRKTLLNTSQIVSVYTEDIDLASNRGRLLYEEYDPAQGTLYTIQYLLTSRREMENVYITAAARDEAFTKIMDALAPSMTITNNEPLAAKLEEIPMEDKARPRYKRSSTAPSEKPLRKPRKPRE